MHALHAAGTYNLTAKGAAPGCQLADGLLDVFNADRDMVKHIVAELFDPPGNDARLATIVTIGLIHKQCWIARGAIDLGKPILIVERFLKPIAQADEWIGGLIDSQYAERFMI